MELEEEQHEQWWDENPEAGNEFKGGIEKREQVLDTLYMGARLRHLSGRIYRTWTLPSEFTPEKLIEFFKREYKVQSNLGYIIFEQRLKNEGLLPALEEVGVVPQEIKNPYDRNSERVQYEQWGAEHPEYVQRAETITYLHAGALIDLILDRQYPQRKNRRF